MSRNNTWEYTRNNTRLITLLLGNKKKLILAQCANINETNIDSNSINGNVIYVGLIGTTLFIYFTGIYWYEFPASPSTDSLRPPLCTFPSVLGTFRTSW